MNEPSGKIVIGLTGNIGVGKSTVMALLAELGAAGIDADKVAHQVMEPGQPAYSHIVARFGPQIAPANGPIDRLRLGHTPWRQAHIAPARHLRRGRGGLPAQALARH